MSRTTILIHERHYRMQSQSSQGNFKNETLIQTPESSQQRSRPYIRATKRRQKGRRRNPGNEIKKRLMFTHQEEEDQDRYYVVEKILDKKWNTDLNEYYYLVKWSNYNSDYNSWEPENELMNCCKTLIDVFNGELPTEELELKHCICNQKYEFKHGAMIQCYHCHVWYHFTCVNLHMAEANCLKLYFCSRCLANDPSKKILYKEKE